MTDILTPDFYDYEWTPLADARIDGEFVALRWPDGVELRAHAWWLRENVVGPGGIDPVTREGTAHPVDFPDDLTVRSCRIGDGALCAEWTDGFAGSLHPGWLRHVAEGRQDVDAWMPHTTVWTSASLPEPPTFSGPEVLADDDALTAWLRSMVEFGLGRLTDVPTDEHAVLAITGRIGAQRDTNFGLDWPVKAEILSNDENTTANTDLRLGGHTDLPTREVPPGFQFLHCLQNEVSGGWSTMADGEAIAEYLRADEPDVFEALSTLRWTFFNRSRDHDHRWSGPILDYGGPGMPLSIRAFYPLKAFPDMAEADIPRAYRAAKRFHQLAENQRFQISYPFAPGDLIGFDNRRILHGRDAFDGTQGRRYLRGTYVDRDEVLSRLRVLERRAAATHRSTPPAISQSEAS